MTSIESIGAPARLFSIFNISLRALDVLFIALSSAILRDSIRQSYWNAGGPRVSASAAAGAARRDRTREILPEHLGLWKLIMFAYTKEVREVRAIWKLETLFTKQSFKPRCAIILQT